jgi:hypothetical protein
MLLVLFLEEYINWALTSEKLIKYLEGQILMVDKIIMVFNVCPNMKHIHSMTTVPSLLALVDNTHADMLGALQWLWVLVNYVPELSGYKAKVSELYRTKGAKKQINLHRKTKVHPLATNAKNEAKTTELKDALLDFLGQMDQCDHNYL